MYSDFELVMLNYAKYIYSTASLVKWLACKTTDRDVADSIPGISTNIKCGLILERGPPTLVRTIG